MMSELTVATDGIRKYGSTSTEAAGRIAQAAAVDLGANIAAVAPAVGPPVGIEFLEAFARAQATHTKDVAALARFYAATPRRPVQPRRPTTPQIMQSQQI